MKEDSMQVCGQHGVFRIRLTLKTHMHSNIFANRIKYYLIKDHPPQYIICESYQKYIIQILSYVVLILRISHL